MVIFGVLCVIKLQTSIIWLIKWWWDLNLGLLMVLVDCNELLCSCQGLSKITLKDPAN